MTLLNPVQCRSGPVIVSPRSNGTARSSVVCPFSIRASLYEQRGVLPPAARRPSGYREYSPATIDRIRLARRMQSVGLSLDEIIDALSAHDTRGDVNRSIICPFE